MNIFCETITVRLNQGIDIRDITYDFEKIVKKYNIETGVLNATVIGSTASITTIEYESGVVADLKRAINKLAPPDDYYEHEKAWHDGNGHSHVQAALLGASISVPVRHYELLLGTWQQIVIINHDNRARERKIEITIIGDTEKII